MQAEPFSQQRAQRYVSILLLLAALLLGLAAAFNFAVDPLQIYRRAPYPPHFSENQRYQNPGLARNYAEPIIVIGTSHTENWLPADVEAAFGQPALKLSVAGSGLYEQGHLTDMAIASGRVERVIWGVDHGSTLWMDDPTDEFGPFPRHLYVPLWRGSVPYLLSIDTLHRSVQAIGTPPRHELATLNAWHAHTEFGEQRVAYAWRVLGERWDDELYEFYAQRVPRWAEVAALMERKLLARIRAHPQVQFELVFMPHSIWEYVNDFRVDNERFFQRLLLKRQIAGWAELHPNLRVWDFETRVEWIHDASRYSDLAHFDLATSRAMLAEIAAADGSPWPVAPPQALATMVLEEMGRLCDGVDALPIENGCPARVACGRARLQDWLQRGAQPEALLSSAWEHCE